LTHRLVSLLFGGALLCVMAVTVLAWQLSRGPVDLGFLTGRIEAALNTEGAPTRIGIGGIALAWEGFEQGLDRPFDLRLRDVEVVDRTGRKRLQIPNVVVSLSVGALLIGRIAPRAVEVDGVRLTVTRSANNTIGVDVGDLTDTTDAPQADDFDFGAELHELMRPSSGDNHPRSNVLSQLRRVRARDVEIHVVDQGLGVTWTASRIALDLVRRDRGGIDLAGSATLASNDQRAALTVTAVSSPDLGSTDVRFAVGAVVPAALGLAGMGIIDAPVSVSGSAIVSGGFAWQSAKADVRLGAGTLRPDNGTVPIRAASVALSATPGLLKIDSANVVLPGSNGAADTTVSLSGAATLAGPRVKATLSLGLDRVTIADLPRFWPEGTGGGARPWLLENVTEGFVHDGHFELALEANRDLSDLSLVSASGSLEAEKVTVHWLRPVPPVEQGRVRVRIVDPETIDIDILHGQQRVGARAPIAIGGGLLHMTGMEQKHQFADVAIQASGPFADVVALLKEPRLQLLSKHPIDLREPGGDATVSMRVSFPMENKVTMDDVGIGVTAHLRQGHLTDVVAGRDLDSAELDVAANKEQLTLKGTGHIGGIATTIDGSMNFLAGRAQDVVQRIAVAGTASVRQLAAAGLDLTDTMSGELPVSATWSQQRNRTAEVAVTADLTGVKLTLGPLAWIKPPGTGLKASARLRLAGQHLTGIDSIIADGAGITVRGSAELAGNRLSAVQLDRIVFGRNNLSGSLRLPQGGPLSVSLSGASLDLGAKLLEKSPRRDRTTGEPPPGPAWNLTGRFGQVFLAHDVMAANVTAEASNDGRIFSRLRLAGVTQPQGRFSVDIDRSGGVRRLIASATDAGMFLRGMDALRKIEGGTLSVSGTYNDSAKGHPLTGSAKMTEFRVRDAPALGRLLQAMTLYGLVDVVKGPGLAFAHLTAPFVLADDELELREARAFSPSLGMTAQGHLDMLAQTIDLTGTVVPAYFFNSMLGKIPFVGELFRSEEGGGLFAASYAIRGSMSDPSVSVNPLSMLTPGFLRKMFGAF
jgi:hypothetical protein